MGTEIENVNNELDAMMLAMDGDDNKAIMELTGQAETDTKPQTGLPRLNINYKEEDDNGVSLKRGTWSVWNGKARVYADSVRMQPLLRMYEWSVWDQDEGRLSCKSIQKPKLAGEFPDSLGGNKCGRLSKKEEEALSHDDPAFLLSRSVNCNQVMYGILNSTGAMYADGSPAPIENMPFMAYFKKSGFIPVSNFIKHELTSKSALMHKSIIEFTTQKQKNGGVIYWTPKLEYIGEAPYGEEEKALYKKFYETVKGSNQAVFDEYRDARKAMSSQEDIDLERRLAG